MSHSDFYCWPAGTRVQLLNRRPEDVSSAGFVDWSFMSVHTWGEDAGGEWLVQVVDSVSEYKHICQKLPRRVALGILKNLVSTNLVLNENLQFLLLAGRRRARRGSRARLPLAAARHSRSAPALQEENSGFRGNWWIREFNRWREQRYENPTLKQVWIFYSAIIEKFVLKRKYQSDCVLFAVIGSATGPTGSIGSAWCEIAHRMDEQTTLSSLFIHFWRAHAAAVAVYIQSLFNQSLPTQRFSIHQKTRTKIKLDPAFETAVYFTYNFLSLSLSGFNLQSR